MKFIYFWRNTTYKNLDKKGVDNLNRLVSNLEIIYYKENYSHMPSLGNSIKIKEIYRIIFI